MKISFSKHLPNTSLDVVSHWVWFRLKIDIWHRVYDRICSCYYVNMVDDNVRVPVESRMNNQMVNQIATQPWRTQLSSGTLKFELDRTLNTEYIEEE